MRHIPITLCFFFHLVDSVCFLGIPHQDQHRGSTSQITEGRTIDKYSGVMFRIFDDPVRQTAYRRMLKDNGGNEEATGSSVANQALEMTTVEEIKLEKPKKSFTAVRPSPSYVCKFLTRYAQGDWYDLFYYCDGIAIIRPFRKFFFMPFVDGRRCRLLLMRGN